METIHEELQIIARTRNEVMSRKELTGENLLDRKSVV